MNKILFIGCASIGQLAQCMAAFAAHEKAERHKRHIPRGVKSCTYEMVDGAVIDIWGGGGKQISVRYFPAQNKTPQD